MEICRFIKQNYNFNHPDFEFILYLLEKWISYNIPNISVYLDNHLYEKDGLYSSINKTKTIYGDIILQSYLLHVEQNIKELQRRQELIKYFNHIHEEVDVFLDEVKHNSDDLIWLWKKKNDEEQKGLNFIYFSKGILMSLNHFLPALQISNILKLYINPIQTIISPIFIMLIPFLVLRKQLGLQISFFSYCKFLKNILFKPMFRLSSKSEFLHLFTTLFSYGFSLYNLYSNCKMINDITNLLHKKLALLTGKRQKTLERELEWVRMAPKGRQSKQKARLSSYERLISQDQKVVDEKLEIYIPNGPRLGANVIEAKGIRKTFGDKLLYEDLNFTLPQAGIVGVIGPNGAGKTTLFRMILGEEIPDSGSFSLGETAKVAYVDQSHSNIDSEKSIWSNFSDELDLIIMGGRQVNSRAYLSRFNFSGNEQNKKVKTLSGGERNRLHLAMTLKEEGNVLLLDEPTNDLDVNTLRALEEGLENFAGCAVVISHDRWFLDRICTHILAFEGDSQVYFFEGSFTDYEENKKNRLGDDLIPKRIQYKRLTRD